jgi:capsular polysaccharide transport system permease protein
VKQNTKQETKPKGPWVKPPARVAGSRKRHMVLVFSFMFMVLVPTLIVYSYLWYWANDQYASEVGFTIRSEEPRSAVELFGGISSISSGSSTDSEILYQFIQSQQMVNDIDAELNLRAMFSKAEGDPIYNFDTSGSIEDLTDYWLRMVKIYYSSSSGLIELRVLAFDADDAYRIATEIVVQCSIKINELSAIARDDATKYARTELSLAVDRLKKARGAITAFRNKYQIVDPTVETESKLGVLSSLQQQLSETYVELDLLKSTTSQNDPRVKQSDRKIKVIKERIKSERQKIGLTKGSASQGFSAILEEYESLSVDLEYAQQTYLSGLTSLDLAQAKAQRKSRYLASYIEPTLAEKAEYPQRFLNLSIIATFLLLFWVFVILIYFSVRDRR